MKDFGKSSLEQKSIQVNRLACFGPLRRLCDPYSEADLEVILEDTRIDEFRKVRGYLKDIPIISSAKLDDGMGFLCNNITHGFVEPVGNVFATGICLPRQLTVQSLLPIFAIKDLLDNRGGLAYFAIPLGAYAGAGLGRKDQYLQTIGIMKRIFGDRLGENIFLLPDYRDDVAEMKYFAGMLSSRFVSDEPSREKYPFGNLFGPFETVSYGTDLVIPALAEEKDVTIVSDFRQFESIHAGIKMSRGLKKRIGALLYTLVNPRFIKGKLKEVSEDDNETGEYKNPRMPETLDLFYHASLLLPPHQAMDIYSQLRRGDDINELKRRVDIAREYIISMQPVSSGFASGLEDITIRRIAHVKDTLYEMLCERMDGEKHGNK